MRIRNRLGFLTIPVLALFAAIPVVAQAPPPATGPAQEQGPALADTQNEPGVARVSFIHGDVSMQRGDNNETSRDQTRHDSSSPGAAAGATAAGDNGS